MYALSWQHSSNCALWVDHCAVDCFIPNTWMEFRQGTVRSLALVCSSAGSISLSEHYFTQSHSWAQSYHSEYFPPPSHFQPFLCISRLFKAIQSNFRHFQAIPDYSRLFHSIPVHFYVYQYI